MFQYNGKLWPWIWERENFFLEKKMWTNETTKIKYSKSGVTITSEWRFMGSAERGTKFHNWVLFGGQKTVANSEMLQNRTCRKCFDGTMTNPKPFTFVNFNNDAHFSTQMKSQQLSFVKRKSQNWFKSKLIEFNNELNILQSGQNEKRETKAKKRKKNELFSNWHEVSSPRK